MSWRCHVLRSVASMACVVGGAKLSAQPLSSLTAETVPMVLEVSLNGTRTAELLDVQRARSGKFSASAADLRRLRLRLDAGYAADAMVDLHDLPGVTLEYDEANQALALQVPDSLLEPYSIDLYGQRRSSPLHQFPAIPAAVLNYGLYHTHQSGKNTVAGNAELLFTGRFGIVSNTVMYNSTKAQYGYDNAVRLESRWQYIDPVSVRSYVLGDFVSNTVSWGASVRLAGFQWASAFDQRSDIVTTALPQFSGSAALPSTLDLYVNQQRIYSGDIPSGPFALGSLPFVSGNEVTLVTTDALGRQTTLTQPYYYSARLLRPALTQFSVDVGLPRLNYGLQSDDYDSAIFATGSWRHGLTHLTTLEARAEGSSDGLFNAGVGLAQGLMGRGVFNAAVSTSRYQAYRGTQLRLGIEGQAKGLRVYGSTDRHYGHYFNLARVSGHRMVQRRRTQGVGPDIDAWLHRTAQASAIDRLGVGISAFRRTSFNVNYHRIRYVHGQTRMGSLSFSYGLSPRLSLHANAYTDIDRRHNRGVFVSLNLVLDKLNASSSLSRDNGRSRYTQQVASAMGQRQGDTSWGVVNTFAPQGSDYRSAYLSHRARHALVGASLHHSGHSTRTELQALGALVAAGGGVFAANQVGDAYAIVTNAGPNVELLQGGVKMGRTDRNGRALLPKLRPYTEQHVRIDPSTLPDGWEPQATEQAVAVGYRQGRVIDFGARAVHGAVLVMHDKHGEPIRPGHLVKLEGGESSVMGYEGQVYLRDLHEHSRLQIDLGVQEAAALIFVMTLTPLFNHKLVR